MQILSVIGSDRESLRDAVLRQAIRKRHEVVVVSAAEPTDYAPDPVLADALGLLPPEYYLDVIPCADGRQIAETMLRIEEIMLSERPDLVTVRATSKAGLAGALSATQLGIPVAHLEAGERSFNRKAHDEGGRLVVDHLASRHFCASQSAVRHLASEGVVGSAYWVGDPLVDVLERIRPLARSKAGILDSLGVKPGAFALICLRRHANVSDPTRVERAIEIANRIQGRVVLLLRPEMARCLRQVATTLAPHVRALSTVGWLEMIRLVQDARVILTDSGTVQREAYLSNVPCLTLWDDTEWMETVKTGWNSVVGLDPERVLAAFQAVRVPAEHPAIFGDGRASERIVSLLDEDPSVAGLTYLQNAVPS